MSDLLFYPRAMSKLKNYPFDIVLDGKGYMLPRAGQMGEGGRAWQVNTIGASIVSRSTVDNQYGNQESIVEFPLAFDDASKGYGDPEFWAQGRYHFSINMDCRFHKQILPGPVVHDYDLLALDTPEKLVEHRGSLYCAAGVSVYYMHPEEGFLTIGTFDNPITDMVVYENVIYVAFGLAEPIQYCDLSKIAVWDEAIWDADEDIYLWGSDEAGDFEFIASTNVYAYKLGVVGDAMYGALSAYEVAKVSAEIGEQIKTVVPADIDNWGFLIRVGDASASITSIVEMDGVAYIGKEDGVYYLSEDGLARKVAPELISTYSPRNCRGMVVWQGALWVPHERGLFYCFPTTNGHYVKDVSPGQNTGLDNPVKGMITAMACDSSWMYALLATGEEEDDDTYLLAGRKASEAEAALGDMIWHPLARVEGYQGQAMCVTALFGNPRVLFGKGNNLAYIILPRSGHNPLMDEACEFSGDGWVYFPASSGWSPTTTKIFKSVRVLADKLTSGRNLGIYYSVDGNSFRLAGRAQSPPNNEVWLNGTQGVAGNRIAIALRYVGPSTSSPPVIRGVSVRAVERPSTVELITVAVRCADNLPLNNGAVSDRSAEQILSALKALAQANKPVLLVDTTGYERWVVVLPAVEERETFQEGDRAREILAIVKMAEFAPGELPDTSKSYGVWDLFAWDDGTIWR